MDNHCDNSGVLLAIYSFPWWHKLILLGILVAACRCFFLAYRTKKPLLRVCDIAVGIGFLVAFVGFMLPTIARVHEPAARMETANQLKFISIALYEYQESFKALPRQAIYSKDGKPLLSWRVAMLPFLENRDLYNEFHLNEPWDSPHNHKLLEKMPWIFTHPKARPEITKKGYTHYQAFVSNHGPMPLIKNGPFHTVIVADPDARVTLKGISDADGLSNTFLLAEAKVAVPWTAPMDLSDTPKLSDLGSLLKGGFLIAYADSSVHLYPPGELTDELLLQGVRANDGKVPFEP